MRRRGDGCEDGATEADDGGLGSGGWSLELLGRVRRVKRWGFP